MTLFQLSHTAIIQTHTSTSKDQHSGGRRERKERELHDKRWEAEGVYALYAV